MRLGHSSGMRLWGGYSLEQIIRRIAVHYPAEQSKQIESDIRATVAVLHDNSMIT